MTAQPHAGPPGVSGLFERRTRAMIDADEGRLPEALAALTATLQWIPPSPPPPLVVERARCLIDRATVLRSANRIVDALEDLDAAGTDARVLPPIVGSGLLRAIALARAKLFTEPHGPIYDIETAARHLAQAREEAGDLPELDDAEAVVTAEVGDWPAVERLSLRAASKFAALGWERPAAVCQLRAGRARFEIGRVVEARRIVTDAHRFFLLRGPPALTAAAQMELARIQASEGDAEGAWSLATSALDIAEGLIRHFRILTEQQRFITDKLALYDRAHEIATATPGREGTLRAWSIAERAKSFYLCQLMANSDVDVFHGVDPHDIASLRELDHRLDALERQSGSAGAEEGVALSADRRALLERIMVANPRWGALRRPPSLDLDVELWELDAGWVPLSYWWDHHAGLHVYWAVDREPAHVRVPWSSDDLDDLSRCRNTLRGRVSPHTEVVPRTLSAKLLPIELRSALRPEHRLLVSTHERVHASGTGIGPSLRHIPLHAVAVEGRPLIEAHAVQYIPSLAMLPLRRDRPRATGLLALGCAQDAFGSPTLRDVETEIHDIEATWQAAGERGNNARIVDASETPDDVGVGVEHWGRFRFIHAACHGIFPEGRPFDAALLLGADAVRADVFFGIRLRADLVSLSACSVGRRASHIGDVSVVGDEWVGLLLPLIFAGASRLVVSLWDANSHQARTVMAALHRGLAAGDPAPDAYRTALRTVSRKPPSLWANWILVGLPEHE
jgi:hypothetical protein